MLGSYRIAFGRFFIGLIFMSSLWASGRIKMSFVNKPILVARGVVGCVATYLMVLAVIQLGVGKGTVILYSHPVYASLFGVYLLKEKLRLSNFAALGLAVFGLYLLVVKSNDFETGFGVGKNEVLAIIGSLLAGLTVITITKLHETDTTFVIFYAQCVAGMIMLAVPAFYYGGTVNTEAILLILGISACSIGGQLLMTEGFRYLPVKTASVLTMSQLVINYVLGMLFFAEVLTIKAFVGAALICVGCVIAVSGREIDKA